MFKNHLINTYCMAHFQALIFLKYRNKCSAVARDFYAKILLYREILIL